MPNWKPSRSVFLRSCRSNAGSSPLSKTAVLLVCLLTGCNTLPKQAPLQEILHRLPSTTELSASASSIPSVDLDIYVDDSGSMRGFVANPNSNFRSILSNLLLSSTSAQLHVNVYPLSSDHSITSTPLSRVEAPDFYEGGDTPLAALLRKIGTRRGHMSILVSDLVLSERAADVQTLATALSDLAVEMPTMKLLAFRSDFNGTYYPESQSGHARSYPVRAVQSIPETGRPFYLLAVTPNQPSMSTLDNYLFNRLSALNSFDPMVPPFDVQNISLKSSSKDQSMWKGVHRFELPKPEERKFGSAYDLKKAPPTEGAPIELPLVITLNSHIPLRSVEAIEVTGEHVRWKSGAFTQSGSIRIPVSGHLSSDQGTLIAAFDLPAPAKQSWDYYRLRLRGGQGNLALPQWVHDWSTDDDSQPANISRTFQLETLVQTMENTISERQLCGEWLLKIGRGN